MTPEQLRLLMPLAPMYWLVALCEMTPKYGISSPARAGAFLGQIRYESVELTRFQENLNYSDPVRIARIFRSPFDLDHDGTLEQAEVDFAKKYVMNPKALASRAYANRLGNGDEASGDGWTYRGRGPIQITFKDNYRLYGSLLAGQRIDLVTNPDEVLVPRVGSEIACAFFRYHGCNELADASNIAAITKKINPALLGLNERVAFTNQSRKILEGT